MRSLVKIDGEPDKIFDSIDKGKDYFMKRKKQSKGHGILMAIYKEIKPNKWIGIYQN